MSNTQNTKGLNWRQDFRAKKCFALIRTTFQSSLLSILLVLIFGGCPNNDNVVGPKPPTSQITTEDVSCTDVWLRIQLADTVTERTLTIQRNRKPILTLYNAPSDTVIRDDSLMPKHTYTYSTTTSLPLTVRTLDTSSNIFTWQFDTLGDDGATSTLYDVAIINDTCVYAVGEIYKQDSTGEIETTPYNMALWNGNTWQLERATFYYRGQPYVTQLYSILAFGMNDIWVGTAGPYHWTGSEWETFNTDSVFNGRVTKFWGTSSINLYMVGDNGSIAHFDGTIWQKIESGTTLPINDIWGSQNKITGEWEILAVASNQFNDEGKKLLKIQGTNVTAVSDSGLSWALNTLWFISGRKYYIGGDGLYPSYTLGPVWYRDRTMPPYYKTSIRGNSLNDLVVVGSYGLFMHYNGMTWFNFQSITYLPDGAYGQVASKGNTVCAVGGNGNKAIALIGKR